MSELRTFAAGELEEILAQFGVVVTPEPTTGGKGGTAANGTAVAEPEEWVPGGFSDAEVLRILFDDFQNGEDYRQLHAGELEYDDESAGDWRLMKAIAWITGPEADQVERLMRGSERYRTKWDKRRGATTLLRWQIDKAIREHTDGDGFYDSRGANALPWFSAGDGEDVDGDEAAIVVDETVNGVSTEPTAATIAVATVDVAADSAQPQEPAFTTGYPTDSLPEPIAQLVEAGIKRGLDAALVAGAAIAAAAVAVGNQAELQAMWGWLERAILWIVLIAPPGVGKSPAQEFAFGPLRARNEALLIDYADQLDAWQSMPQKTRPANPPADPSLLTDDSTLEALARSMSGNGAIGADLDELSGFLLSLGQYKQSANSDRARLLRLWTGGPWRYVRVGSGGRTANAVNLFIARPTLVIVGGLPTEQHALLGDDRDGLRPRFLPHLAGRYASEPADLLDVDVSDWAAALDNVLSWRDQKRTWRLSDEAKLVFQEARKRWKRQERGDETASTAAALAKADVHALRVALVLAEVATPGQGGLLSEQLMAGAVRVVDFVLDGWRALGSGEHIALSFRDQALNAAIPRLVAWLQRRGAVYSDLIRQNHVGGIHTAAELDAVLKRYEAMYPDSVQTIATGQRGRPAILVSPPAQKTPP